MHSGESGISEKLTGKGILYRFSWPNLTRWQRVALIFIAFLITTEIAVNTNFDVHPDERMHYDAFQYYEQNWWPPDIGSDEILYSPHGWSRLYTGETIYFIFGKTGGFLNTIVLSNKVQKSQRLAVLPYRFLNILLFILTLTILLFVKFQRFELSYIAYVLLVIPQIYYIYSYANSDAWGISIGIFLFVLASKMTEKNSSKWSWFEISLLGILSGFILTSKINYLLSVILPFILLTIRLFKDRITFNMPFLKWIALRMIYIVCIAFLIYAPFGIIYKNTFPDFDSQISAMMQEKARPWYRAGVKVDLADQGETYLTLVINHPFIQTTYKSFIGVFGYFTVWLPPHFYTVFGLLLSASILLTIIGLVKQWKYIELYEILAFILSPIIIAANLFGSMHYSLNSTYQPQGRYLFVSIIPFAFLLMGTTNFETGKWRMIRIIITGLMYIFCIISLLTIFSSQELGL